ncbi:hypothetical protein KAW65_02095 [candidate division WOR-3 bacterium]|nr:hypothetical protein [candidate division WOR-3 bacterium]
MNEEVTIIDYFRVIKNKWWVLVLIFVIAEITNVFIISTRPEIYESTASVLSPMIPIETVILVPSDFSKVHKEEILPSLYVKEPASQIIAMLKSRRMKEDVMEKFELDAVKKLHKSTTIHRTKEGTILITVRAMNPELAANIADFYVLNLDKINEELKVGFPKPVVTLLDSAIPADRPLKVRIKLQLLTTGFLSIFVGLLLLFFINYIEELRKTV